MINPVEFEWIVDPKAQQQLATTIADGIGQWLQAQSNASGLDSSRH
jgi:N-acetylmuramoyl-L-alanine amidase